MLIVLIIISVAVLLPVDILKSFNANLLLNILYNGFFLVIAVAFVLNSTFFGRRLLRVLSVYGLNPVIDQFLRKVILASMNPLAC